LFLTLNGTLHPYHTAAGNVGFQCWDGCRVVRNEVSDKVVVPVKDDHSILTEVEPTQVAWRKHTKSMPRCRDRSLDDGRAKWIVGLEDCKVVRCCMAI